jgi:predicted metalloprotease with PDZ domain
MTAPLPVRRLALATTSLLLLGCAGRGAAPVTTAGAPSGVAVPRYAIAYRLTMPDPSEHLYTVELSVDDVRQDTLKLQLPVWSPGRYSRMDFAKNVQEFEATDQNGVPFTWDKETGSLWRVYPRGGSSVRVRYRVFANDLSGTFSVLDTAHANFNGPSIFMYVEGHKPDPVRLTIVPPAGWRIMSGAVSRANQTEFTFPNYDLLIDTPTEIAPSFTVDSFPADSRIYRVMLHHNGPDAGQRARFVRFVEAIVRYENKVIAPPPLETYTFLVNVGYGGGDGMEHLYSTNISAPRPWTDSTSMMRTLDIVSHEYFHTWLQKRIRPAALGPFDYSKEVFQPSLWVTEGWTQYYGVIAPHRAGLIARQTLYESLAGTIRYNSESPGRKELSARMSSFHAPFWDGNVPEMNTNRANTWISYYFKGEALAWLLDLHIRARTSNTKSLDDVLRLLKERTWDARTDSYYLQGRGFTEDDVEQAATDVAGEDMRPWFARYVGGTDELPWDEYLRWVGLRVQRDGEGGDRTYTLEEDPAATPDQRLLREGWLAGTTSTPTR